MFANLNLQLNYWRRAGYKLQQTSSGAIALTIHPLLQPQVPSILKHHQAWLKRALKPRTSLPGNRADYQEQKELARELISQRIEILNQQYGFTYGRVSIRHTSTRWGSCSRQGNLNFSYKLLYLPSELRDYVIVHELCHLKEMNHSPRFWALVGQTVPNYKDLRHQLRGYSLKQSKSIPTN